MHRKQNQSLVSNAKELRRNMTREERHLWYDFLKSHPARFTRQKVLGKYIVDFYCAEAKIAIELDGSQHYEVEARKKDGERDAFLKKYGLSIIRIPNIDINRNFTAVCEYIDRLVKKAMGYEEN